MATIKFKRGLKADATKIVPKAGEPLVALDTKELFIGDGVTPGGFPVQPIKIERGEAGDLLIFKDSSGLNLSPLTKDVLLASYYTKDQTDAIFATVSDVLVKKAEDADKLGGEAPSHYLNEGQVLQSVTSASTTDVVSAKAISDMREDLSVAINEVETKTDVNTSEVASAKSMGQAAQQAAGAAQSTANTALKDSFAALRRSYGEAGYALVDGSCEEGALLTKDTDVVLYMSNGVAYSHTGDFPFNVPQRTNPSAVGGYVARNTELLSTVVYPQREDGYDVFLVYGQSNAVGYAAGTPGFPAVTTKAAWWNNQTRRLESIVPALKSSSGEVSTGHAWASFANEYVRLTGRKVIIIPAAKGGTAIADLSRGSGPYVAMQASVTNFNLFVAENNIKILSRSLCFHQGETDMSGGTTHNEYIQLFDVLLRNIRSDFSVDKTFIWRCGCPQNRTEESWYAIQSAQDYVCQSYDWAIMVYAGCGAFTLGNGLLREGVHYTQKGYNVMGLYGARGAAGALFDNSPSSQDEISLYGQLLTSPDQIWRYTYGRATYTQGSLFSLIDIDSPNFSYRTCNIKAIENLTDRLRFHIQSRADYAMGFSASVNTVGALYGISVVTQLVATGANTWAIDVYFNKDIEFVLSLDTGALANPDGSTTDIYPWIEDLLTVTPLGEGLYRVNHPRAQGHPSLTQFYAESVAEAAARPLFLTSVTATSCRVKSFSTGGAKALIRLHNAAIPVAALPEGLQVDVQAVVAAKKL